MSATNRGSKRRNADQYITPEWVIESFLDEFTLAPGTILEPTAGTGVIVKAIRKRYENVIIANELYQNEELEESGADKLLYINYLNTNIFGVSTIITNPPYSLAEEVIEHSFVNNPDADVIMLLRLNFLGSQKRKAFFERYPVKQLYVLSKRPCFTNDGKTDATEYAFFVFSKSRMPLIKVI